MSPSLQSDITFFIALLWHFTQTCLTVSHFSSSTKVETPRVGTILNKCFWIKLQTKTKQYKQQLKNRLSKIKKNKQTRRQTLLLQREKKSHIINKVEQILQQKLLTNISLNQQISIADTVIGSRVYYFPNIANQSFIYVNTSNE